MEEFHKVRRLPQYVFEQVNRLKASARAAGADIIDLGMGNPDLPTPKAIVDKLCEVVQDPRTHRYSSSKGIPGLRRAQAAYYARRFGVKLNPDTQVVATLGSKEGFANMASAKQGQRQKSFGCLRIQNGLKSTLVSYRHVLKLQDQGTTTTLPQTGPKRKSFFKR